MTKALVTIEIDIDTGSNINEGLGVSSVYSFPGIRHIEDEKRGEIWERVHDWLKDQNGFIGVTKVSLTKKAGA